MKPSESRKINYKNKLEKDTVFEFFAPQAQDVQLAGSFNNWDASHWRLSLKLKPGRYEYRYLVDGNWENDQRPVICVPNAFGTWNCVIEIT